MKTQKQQTSIEWTNNELSIELDTKILGKKKFNPVELSRHLLVLGSTGTGKTASAIKPLLKGFWFYVSKEGCKYSVLVVDPKNELIGTLNQWDEQNDQKRVVNLSEVNLNKRLNPFEGIEKYQTLADKLEYFFSLFGAGKSEGGDNAIFRDSGLSLLREFCDIEEQFFNKTKQSLLTMLAKMWGVRDLDRVSLADGLFIFAKKGHSASMLPHNRVNFSDVGLSVSDYDERYYSDKYSVFDLMEILLSVHAPELLIDFENFSLYQKDCKNVHKGMSNLKQFGYYVSYWDLMLQTLQSERYKAVFDLNLALEKAEAEGQIARWMDAGKVLVILPVLGSIIDEKIVQTIKGLVFNYMLTRKNMLAPMAYVADEFHNFISTDEETGEQNFLDKCRSYRVSCLLATQGIDSLSDRVQRQNGTAGAMALNSMLTNLGNRMVFRTLDSKTASMMRDWIEPSPLNPTRHVLSSFPIAQLEVGECYWVRGSEWSREKIVLPVINTNEPEAQPTMDAV